MAQVRGVLAMAMRAIVVLLGRVWQLAATGRAAGRQGEAIAAGCWGVLTRGGCEWIGQWCPAGAGQVGKTWRLSVRAGARASPEPC